ncbi:MAG: helix-turn-helix transcriptional regulator, partial [Chloroflexota bacterium]|nr:helix-turn-helix transcriptional regulator [Chloroflexota bacterium]
AELALADGDGALALAIAERLGAAAGNLLDLGVIEGLQRVRGEALAALGQLAEAEATLRAMQEAALRRALRPLLWRNHVALGRFYHSQRRSAEAEREFAAARAIIDHLGANAPDDPVPDLDGESLREHFLRVTTALLPRPRPPTPRRAAKQRFGGLTMREREVAVLIAQGKSNRAIAKVLIIGERTVQTHISNIFAKLGCSSRAQVAAWAVANGLAEPSG